MDTHRKYSPGQLETELARPKKKGGRPRKYATEEERRAARAAYARAHYWRKKCDETGIEITADIAPKRRILTTDEERAEARRATALRQYYGEREKRLLRRAALRAQP